MEYETLMKLSVFTIWENDLETFARALKNYEE
jgi:hypothetical protein